jgi:hypothetical protein
MKKGLALSLSVILLLTVLISSISTGAILFGMNTKVIVAKASFVGEHDHDEAGQVIKVAMATTIS